MPYTVPGIAAHREKTNPAIKQLSCAAFAPLCLALHAMYMLMDTKRPHAQHVLCLQRTWDSSRRWFLCRLAGAVRRECGPSSSRMVCGHDDATSRCSACSTPRHRLQLHACARLSCCADDHQHLVAFKRSKATPEHTRAAGGFIGQPRRIGCYPSTGLVRSALVQDLGCATCKSWRTAFSSAVTTIFRPSTLALYVAPWRWNLCTH